jgi:hypothetical protein
VTAALQSADQIILERALREILWGTSSRQPLEVKEVISQLELKLQDSELMHAYPNYNIHQLAHYGLSSLEKKRIVTHNRLLKPDESGGQTYCWLQR